MGIDGAAHVPSKLSLVAKLQAGVCARAASNSEVPPRCHRRAPWIRQFPTTPPSMHTTHRQPVLLMKEKACDNHASMPKAVPKQGRNEFWWLVEP